ncbi:MAG: efflux RND transporter periplasmic adaptor subunit [Merismopedia sp. SIO2A8]|nr:efflux RND transporter periplasmic adaptor subunit [Merismopedia sp. SIO2A8]
MTQASPKTLGKFTWLWWPSLLVVLVAGGWWGYGRWSNPSSGVVRVQLTTATIGTVEDPITQVGTVKLGQQQVLESLGDGRVAEVFVSEGDRITTGQTLLRLQDDDWENDWREHEINVQKGEVTLALRQQAIATAEVQLQDAKDKLAGDQDLFDQGYVSENDVEQSSREVRDAETRLREVHLDLEREGLEMQSLRIKGQKLEQELLSQQILAPSPAMVLDLIVQPGSVVETGTSLMVLGNPGREVIFLKLSPLRAQQVKPFQLARVQPLGPNAETYTATVKDVALLAGTGEEENTGGQFDLDVTVELDAPSDTLIPGTQVSVDILLDQRIDVVRIEAGAIQQGEEGTFVWMVGPNGTAQKQAVEIGLEGLTDFEVIKGLEDGDQVIVLPEQPLSEGTSLEIINE